MRVAIIGSGIVGRTLALGLQRAGHDVVVGTRDPDATGRRAPGLEMWLPLWVRLMGALGTAEFNVKVVR